MWSFGGLCRIMCFLFCIYSYFKIFYWFNIRLFRSRCKINFKSFFKGKYLFSTNYWANIISNSSSANSVLKVVETVSRTPDFAPILANAFKFINNVPLEVISGALNNLSWLNKKKIHFRYKIYYIYILTHI